MIDFEIQRCTRRCARTERELRPSEEFYSVLAAEGAEVIRYDYSIEAWQGPPEGALGWWKSQMPEPNQHKMHWAPNDVMLDLLEQLEDQPKKQDFRYVLALLLVRRRVVRLEESERNASGGETLVLHCAKKETTYKVDAVTPNAARSEEIQEELAQLLFADAA